MTLIIGERYRERLEKSLSDRGAAVFWLPDNPDIDPRLAGHADLSVFMPDNTSLVVAKGVYPYIVNSLTNEEYAIIQAGKQGPSYPEDVGLCVCATGQYTIYNPKTVEPAVKPLLAGTLVPVTQGYTKCSVCVVSSDSIITSDSAIASRAGNAGMGVLEITPGYIVLDGYDHGFIGGASFLLDEQRLAFTGTLDGHPDKSRILAFLQNHGVKPTFLTDGPIFDIGGAIALP